jgi:hypothetical protein
MSVHSSSNQMRMEHGKGRSRKMKFKTLKLEKNLPTVDV